MDHVSTLHYSMVFFVKGVRLQVKGVLTSVRISRTPDTESSHVADPRKAYPDFLESGTDSFTPKNMDK
jgi:hypothetical protein